MRHIILSTSDIAFKPLRFGQFGVKENNLRSRSLAIMGAKFVYVGRPMSLLAMGAAYGRRSSNWQRP